MIHLTSNTTILIATQPADIRQGIDGLAAVCQHKIECNPRSGTLFVFINRNKTMIRALVYEENGVWWLMTKRLSKGKFSGWPSSTLAMSPMAAKHLRQLLHGHLFNKIAQPVALNAWFLNLSDHTALHKK